MVYLLYSTNSKETPMQPVQTSMPYTPHSRSGALFIHREDLPNRELIHTVVQRTKDVLNMNPDTVPDVLKEKEHGLLETVPSLGRVKSVTDKLQSGNTFWKSIITQRGIVDVLNTKKGMTITFQNRPDLEPYFQDQLSQVFPTATPRTKEAQAHQPVQRINILG
jgi:hypothetical protein